jgi:hypothetical protein
VAVHARLPGQGRRGRLANIRDNLKVYPLAKKDSPPPMEFINVSGMEINTVLPNDFSFFEKLHTVIQEEPAGFLGPEPTGQMAAIGIEKGKPFEPDARMLEILTDAAAIGNAAARAISFFAAPPGNSHLRQGQRLVWPMINGHHLHGQQRRPRARRPRIFYHFGYICVSPAMASKCRARARTTPWAWWIPKDGRWTAPRPTSCACRRHPRSRTSGR